MGTTLKIALRYLTARREGRGISIVPLLSGLGIMLGVATLVVVMAVFEGYRQEILSRLLERTGHIVVSAPGGQPFDPSDALAVIEGAPEVERADAVMVLQGLLLNGNQGAGVVLQGLTLDAMKADPTLSSLAEAYVPAAQPASEDDFSGLVDAVAGEGSSSADDAFDFDALAGLFAEEDSAASSTLSPVWLGVGLAQTLGVTKGDELRLVLSADRRDRAEGSTAARSFGLQVEGLFSAGLFEADQAGAVTLLNDVQSWREQPGSVSEIRVMLKDLGQRQAYHRALAQQLPVGIFANDRATQLFRDYEWVRAQGNAATLIVVVILIVAAFGIASGQLMMVQERRADIAILRGFGVQGGGVLRIFLAAGLLVALIGLVLGLALGWWVSVSLNDIRLFIEGLIGRPLLDADYYQIDELNGVVQPGGLIFVSLVTIAVSFAATLYPAWRASRVPPALALKEV